MTDRSIHYAGLDNDGFVYIEKWDGSKFVEVQGVIVPRNDGRVLVHMDDGQHLLVPDLAGIAAYFKLTKKIKENPERYQ